MDSKIDVMFKNLCCSRCKSDFSDESVRFLRKEDAMIVINLHCNRCGKDFGVAFIGTKNLNAEFFDREKTPLRMIEDLPPISKDDVLDAHKFIKDLDEHWTKYLPE
ncbi:hypothetical protein IJ707_07545 [bacterium]|nr:hypothetical protein [bacterium]